MVRVPLLIVLLTAMAFVGCQKGAPDATVSESTPSTSPAAEATTGGDVAILSPDVGGITPVESNVISGQGSGVGQAAKDKARSIAAGGVGSASNAQDGLVDDQ